MNQNARIWETQYRYLDTRERTMKMICNRSLYCVDWLGKRKYDSYIPKTFPESWEYLKSQTRREIRRNSTVRENGRRTWYLPYSNLVDVFLFSESISESIPIYFLAKSNKSPPDLLCSFFYLFSSCFLVFQTREHLKYSRKLRWQILKIHIIEEAGKI